MNEQNTIIFGPVPSRRLGKSIGINNIPPKKCTYSCIYCQLGRTHHMQNTRESFYDPDEIIQQTIQKIKHTKQKQEHIDFLTLVPDGETTLDKNLGVLINKLKDMNYPVAVITNSSLLPREDVRSELLSADWVSVKLDAIHEKTWKKINRAYGKLNYENILNGIKIFSNQYTGSLCTETMLIQDINDNPEELQKLANFIAKIKPKTSFLSVPIRPPAESWVKTATEKTLTLAYQLFIDKHIPTEYLIGYEGNEFAFTGNVEQDILGITSVHPMRQDAVEQLLKKANAKWNVIERLINEQKIVKHTFNNITFYSRTLPKR